MAEEHFLSAEQAALAGFSGDPAALQAAARQIEAPEGGDREAAEALHAAVGFLQVAEGPEETAEGLVEMAEACAACHAAVGRTFGVDALPPEGSYPEREGRCLRLWWAVALELEGELPALIVEAAGEAQPPDAALEGCVGGT